MGLYHDIKAAGIAFSNHSSDLYFEATPEALAILSRYPLEKGNATRFINQAPPHKGQLWVDVPFAFEPFWDRAAEDAARRRKIMED
jgi:hypothetical protein